MGGAARLLATGFGPFPGAPENPTEELMRRLAGEPAEAFGAGVLHAVALPTDYAASWAAMERLHAELRPDVVVHFGLAAQSETIRIECVGRNAADAGRPDIGGHVPSCLVEAGPARLAATFPARAILAALHAAGFAAELSDDAGGYVCNATLYRSLHVAPPGRRVGFVHVPPEGRGGYHRGRLAEAARVILRTALQAA
jgi:pyroglutamyl-peptidase